MAGTSSASMLVRSALAREFAAIDDLTVAIYLAEGFTSPNYVDHIGHAQERAASADLLVAVDEADGAVLGSVTLALHGGPYAQIAGAEEAEFRLLVVGPAARGRGAGEALVRACIDRARTQGRRRLVLSTQPSMTAAHRLYERLGFSRAPSRDWILPHGVPMLVYTLIL